MTDQPIDCIIPEIAQIAEGVTTGPRVVLAGERIVLLQNARLDAAVRSVGPKPATTVQDGMSAVVEWSLVYYG